MEGLEIKKNKLREKVEKIYNAFKKFNTVIERGGIKFKFTILLPPVATINFKEVAQMNDFGFVYDDDGEIVIEKLEPYLIIPRFYIIYDEEMIENLEWSQKPDYMWLESKIKEKILKNFKNFKTDVSHFGKAVWRTFEKTNLDDISDLWNPNFKNGLLSESWDIEKPLNHIFDDKAASKYELLSSTITDQERNHLKKRAQKIYHTYNNGSFTAHLVSDETTSIDLKINYSLPDVPNSFNVVLTKPEGSLNGRLTSFISLLISDIKLYIDFDNPYHQPLKDLIKNSLDKSGEYYTIPTKGKKRGLIVTDIILQAFKKDILKNFKRFNINVHLRWMPKLEVAVNEGWSDEGYKDSQYVKDLEQNPISDEDYNRLLKKAKALYFTFKEGDFTTQFQHPESGANWAKGKTHYVLPDEPRSFMPKFRRLGGDWWDSEDEKRTLMPQISVADSEIKLYIVPTDDINVNERLHRIYTQYLIKNGDYYTLPPEEAGSNGVNKIVDELRKNMHHTISKKFHKFNSQIGFFIR